MERRNRKTKRKRDRLKEQRSLIERDSRTSHNSLTERWSDILTETERERERSTKGEKKSRKRGRNGYFFLIQRDNEFPTLLHYS